MDFSNKFAASRFAFISDLHTFHILESKVFDARYPGLSLLAQLPRMMINSPVYTRL